MAIITIILPSIRWTNIGELNNLSLLKPFQGLLIRVPLSRWFKTFRLGWDEVIGYERSQ